ncbi:MAG TPA: acyltransferase [Acidimicrobiales bacterium]|nr:acyltransferase [Acidimicrobiales bacterium]
MTALDPTVRLHAQSLCETADVGARTRIWAFTHLLPGARVGADCNLCDGVFVEGGVRIGDRVTVKNGVAMFDGLTVEDDVFIGPNAVFTNDPRPRRGYREGADHLLATLVRRGATIGANATVVCGRTVGEYSFVGAGAVVTRDVPAHALVTGVPARRRGWVCQCGERLDAAYECGCGRRYEMLPGDAGLALVAGAVPLPGPSRGG